MLNFADLKKEIAAIVTTEAAEITADDVKIGFTTRAYEIGFDGLKEDLTAEQACKIVGLLGKAVVKTIEFATAGKDNVIVVFDMNR